MLEFTPPSGISANDKTSGKFFQFRKKNSHKFLQRQNLQKNLQFTSGRRKTGAPKECENAIVL